MKSYSRLLSCMLCLSLLMTACSPSAPELPVQESTQTTMAESTPKDASSAEGVVFVSGDDLPKLLLENTALCSVTFTEGTLKTQGEIHPKSGGRLVLNDSSGNEWILIVPPHALAAQTTITLSEITALTSTDLSVPFSGGIKLEPDGLTFMAPATLKYTPKASDGDLIPLMGSHDGTAMDFTSFDLESKTLQLDHFSSLVFTDKGSLRKATTLPEVEKKVLLNAEKNIAFARKFLESNKGDIPVPTPPRISLACDGNASLPSAEKFVKDAYEPEGLLIRMLLKDLAGIQLLELETSLENQIITQIHLLIKRLEVKAGALLKSYKGQPDYLIPVANFALKVAKDMDLLNFSESAEEGKSFIVEAIGPWIESSLAPILEALREEHDYQQADVAMKVATWASLFMGDQSDKILSEIKKAMAFEMTLSIQYTTLDGTYAIDATVPLTYDFFANDTGNYLKGSANPTFTLTTSVPTFTMSASPHTVNVLVTELDPCLGMGKFIMDGLYASGETMVIEGESYPSVVTKPWWEFAFEAYVGNKGGEKLDFMNTAEVYTFPFTINNKNAVFASESIDGQNNSKGKMTITLEYTITHKPQ